ncbi:hypothetical protein Q8A73_018267 [Channa argus]|nr:hypothetical protein Q8A73_018267 [Channa argus]
MLSQEAGEKSMQSPSGEPWKNRAYRWMLGVNELAATAETEQQCGTVVDMTKYKKQDLFQISSSSQSFIRATLRKSSSYLTRESRIKRRERRKWDLNKRTSEAIGVKVKDKESEHRGHA